MQKNVPKVFVVHGHNELARLKLCQMLSAEFGLQPVVLADQPALGKTIIELFEHHASQCALAVVLLTADDFSSNGEKATLRARQNVIFELGYFCSSLGRERVCLVYEDGVELPSDLSGVKYYSFTESIMEVESALRKHVEEIGLICDQMSSPTILIVDDDLTSDSRLVRQLRLTFKNHGVIEVLADPERACTLLASGRAFLGCITDIVFRHSSTLAGVHVAEVALQNHIEVAVITGHKNKDLGIALSELRRIGINEARILTKPVTLVQYKHFLLQMKGWFLGANA